MLLLNLNYRGSTRNCGLPIALGLRPNAFLPLAASMACLYCKVNFLKEICLVTQLLRKIKPGNHRETHTLFCFIIKQKEHIQDGVNMSGSFLLLFHLPCVAFCVDKFKLQLCLELACKIYEECN